MVRENGMSQTCTDFTSRMKKANIDREYQHQKAPRSAHYELQREQRKTYYANRKDAMMSKSCDCCHPILAAPPPCPKWKDYEKILNWVHRFVRCLVTATLRCNGSFHPTYPRNCTVSGNVLDPRTTVEPNDLNAIFKPWIIPAPNGIPTKGIPNTEFVTRAAIALLGAQ